MIIIQKNWTGSDGISDLHSIRVENIDFAIWDNQKHQVVNYGRIKLKANDSWEKSMAGIARLILIKSPFYKTGPPRSIEGNLF
jgi:hypothetical protein